ncbi:hypothetical protein Hanom_Chr04g00314601 [Helianthus anomalus]
MITIITKKGGEIGVGRLQVGHKGKNPFFWRAAIRNHKKKGASFVGDIFLNS